MEVIAKLNNLNIAPRKVRLITDTIKGQNTKEALDILQFLLIVPHDHKKLLDSAIANATHNFNLSADNLKIGIIKVDGGRVGKKFFPRAQGSATTLRSRTSNITIVLREIVPGVKGTTETSEKVKTVKEVNEKKGSEGKLPSKIAAKPVIHNKNFNVAPKKAKVFNRKAI